MHSSPRDTPDRFDDILAPSMIGQEHQTWCECPDCGCAWKQEEPTPGVLHRYVVCYNCHCHPES